MKKLITMKKLKEKADKVFSIWIRARDKNICFTCGKKTDHPQNGHYISRRHTNTRYSKLNCHCQCVACNIFQKGNMQSYSINLIKLYGDGILQKLYREAHKTKKCDRTFLNNIIETYGENKKTTPG